MSDFGITKTIPAGEGADFVDSLYDGRLKDYEFHMAGSPSKLQVGHWVYTIHEHRVVGRLRITGFTPGAINPKSGRPRTLIHVEAPGERARQAFPRKGHQGTRYYEGEDWPGARQG